MWVGKCIWIGCGGVYIGGCMPCLLLGCQWIGWMDGENFGVCIVFLFFLLSDFGFYMLTNYLLSIYNQHCKMFSKNDRKIQFLLAILDCQVGQVRVSPPLPPLTSLPSSPPLSANKTRWTFKNSPTSSGTKTCAAPQTVTTVSAAG